MSYILEVKGACSDDYAIMVAETCREKIKMQTNDIEKCILVVGKIINFIPKSGITVDLSHIEATPKTELERDLEKIHGKGWRGVI